jgi:hypothetical protein
MSSDVIALYMVSIAAVVSALIGKLVKPVIEGLPFANPAQPASYNPAVHDALLRLANVVFNTLGVLLMASMNNQLTLNNWFTVALQIIVQAIGSHSFYQAVKPAPSAPMPVLPASLASATTAPSPAVIAAAMNAAIAASQHPAASFSVGMPNAVKQPGDTPPAV